ncbi:alkaline phosphatase family protein [Urechidicola vernalis]|uniref:Alkaline phosphatase family protein n=1 Tax=Urechidicola vernalis TaxID=3075600 RepID=A0ABU2Y4F9_9FLAO|nr:alkaline phosphatase family protein [Urechidicola sp. P050]MDT0553072.1 alkaline phosphatase family protein [Urechidicola sp. P050]
MSNLKSSLLALLLCLVLNNYSQKNDNYKKAFLILLDGIPADIIESVETPNLDEISAKGGYARAHVGGEKGGYSQTPTISAPGYNCLLTGTWYHKHNVKGNSITDPNYNYWSIYKQAKESKPHLKTAIFSTWLDNRTKLLEGATGTTNSFKFDYSFDGFEHDTIQFPHSEDRKFIFNIDEHVSTHAADYVLENGPDVSWMYLEFTDDIGHKFGDSPQMYEAVKLADKQVGRVWNSLKQRMKKYNEDWMIVITTDHGRNKKDGTGHGGQSERERLTWIVTNKETNEHFKNQPGIVSIAPSVLNHLDIDIPEERAFELDGTSFINDIVISDLSVIKKDDELHLNWKSHGESEKIKILLCTTNNFKEGIEDVYKKVKKKNSMDESAIISLENNTSIFYKVVLKSSKNSVNYWVK